jgi:ribosomal-protein-serine acetyltransferase
MSHLEVADDAVEFVKTRTFNASLSLVWRVWTEVEHRNAWWGTILVSGTVEEVVANERLVTSGVIEINGVAAFHTRLDVAFAEHAGTTSVTVRQAYWNFAGDRKDVIDGASAGWTVQLDRLEAYIDRCAIDELTRTFFGAFTNIGGVVPKLDTLYELLLPEAIIVKNINAMPVVYDVNGFVQPRRILLTDGSLVDFSEEETSERTDVFGNIAQRFSCYKKSWMAQEQSFAGSGTNSFQYVRTPAGWKIASVIWDDN